MKRKELYNYIREEIINELSEGAATDAAKDAGVSNPAAAAKAAVDAAKKSPTGTSSIVGSKGTKIIDKSTPLEEDSLEEMARTPNNVKIGDPAKLAIAKKLYAGTWKGDMLDVVEKAGEAGISQMELAKAVGKTSQPAINPSVNEFLKIGAFALTKVAAPKAEEPTAEPEMKPTVEPGELEIEKDEDEVEKDEWEKPEEEEEAPEEPKVADIKAADKEAAKIAGGKGYAKTLSPEDEEKYAKLRKGIEAKVAKLITLSKAKRAASDDMKILRQLITRDDVKKLFKAKGVDLKDIVADVMG